MKKDKDFTYYGKMRFKVRNILNALEKDSKYDHSFLWCGICFVLVAVVVNLQNILQVDLGIIGGVLSAICIAEFIWCLGNCVTYIVCKQLDKYYWRKRVELFNQYIEQKRGKKRE